MLRLAFILLLLPGAVLSEGFKHRIKSPDAPPLPVIEFYCTDSVGARREMGEFLCITASCQTWMARCEMALNNPVWRKVQDGCPGVGIFDRINALRPDYLDPISSIPTAS